MKVIMNKETLNKLRDFLLHPDELHETTTSFDEGYEQGWNACRKFIYEKFLQSDDLDEEICAEDNTDSYKGCCAKIQHR